MALTLSKKAPRRATKEEVTPAKEVMDALQAAVGKMAQRAVKQEAVEQIVVKHVKEEMEGGGGVLITNVLRAKALGTGVVEKQAVAMTHDLYGTFMVRAVQYNNGYLVGVIDSDNATYCECEFYPDKDELELFWNDWLKAMKA